jgi:transposase
LLPDLPTRAQATLAAGQPGSGVGLPLVCSDSCYLGAYTAGIRGYEKRTGPLARDAATLARRFRDPQDMILRFVVDLAVPFTNNQAERDLCPVKIQQRTSGGTWRTLASLADFAVVQSYLSTARKWGIASIDALTRLFTTGACYHPPPPGL